MINLPAKIQRLLFEDKGHLLKNEKVGALSNKQMRQNKRVGRVPKHLLEYSFHSFLLLLQLFMKGFDFGAVDVMQFYH